MRIDLDFEIGGESSNSYVSLLEANSYFNSKYGYHDFMSPKDLSNLGLTITEIKSQLLITATQLLETYVNWFGKKADVSQSLSWPRTNTDYLDSDIPKPVKLATFELANYLAKNEQLTWTSSEISQAKVGPINVSFNTEDAEFGIPSFISKLLDSVGEAVTKRPNAAYSIRTVRV